jgi:hypothetical protein
MLIIVSWHDSYAMHVLMEMLVMSSIIDIENSVLMEIRVMSSIISVENSVCST